MKYRNYIITAVLAWLLLFGLNAFSKNQSALNDRLSTMEAQLAYVQQQASYIPTPSPTPAPTPIPTAIPTPSPVPISYTITTEEIIQALIAAGLPIVRYETYDAITDPNELIGRPHAYIDKTNFFDSRIGTSSYSDCGMLEIFANEEDAEARYAYVDNLMLSGLGTIQYELLYVNVLLRFDADFDPEQVDEYDAAMKMILGIKE
ncbi:MAG: hypothetical protein ABFC56_09670 [Clostridiaceae bacterium]